MEAANADRLECRRQQLNEILKAEKIKAEILVSRVKSEELKLNNAESSFHAVQNRILKERKQLGDPKLALLHTQSLQKVLIKSKHQHAECLSSYQKLSGQLGLQVGIISKQEKQLEMLESKIEAFQVQKMNRNELRSLENHTEITIAKEKLSEQTELDLIQPTSCESSLNSHAEEQLSLGSKIERSNDSPQFNDNLTSFVPHDLSEQSNSRGDKPSDTQPEARENSPKKDRSLDSQSSFKSWYLGQRGIVEMKYQNSQGRQFEVTVSQSRKNGNVSLSVLAENASDIDKLKVNKQQISAALKAQGIKITQFKIEKSGV